MLPPKNLLASGREKSGCGADSLLAWARGGASKENISRQDCYLVHLILHLCLSVPICAGPSAWGPGQGQEHLLWTPALEGLTACPSRQDLPDPVYDATKVQLPQCGPAFYDETGEEIAAWQPCRDSSQPQGLCPCFSLCLKCSSCHPHLARCGYLTVISLTGL